MKHVMTKENENWFEEKIHTNYTQKILRQKNLFRGKSDFQELEVFLSELFGKVLLLDGAIQVTENDEFFYHEIFAHIPLNSFGPVKNVLIIGGGDGCLLRETLKHTGVSTTVVEIDAAVVEVVKKYIPELPSGAFDDTRAKIVVGDGLKFVDTTTEKFDVILIDSTDPDNISDNLFTTKFLVAARDLLTENGILVMQSGTPFLQSDVFKNAKVSFKSVFDCSGFFYATIPTYSGGQHAFAWGSRKDISKISIEAIKEVVQRNKYLTNCKHYNPAVHVAAFAESTYLSRL